MEGSGGCKQGLEDLLAAVLVRRLAFHASE